MKKHVWICGTHRCRILATIPGVPRLVAWELNGIFPSKKKAVARCKTADDFVAKVPFDKPLAEKTLFMEDCEYPLCAIG